MKKIKISSILTYFFLGVGAIIMIFPFFWMITGSFKTSNEVNIFPPKWLPGSLNFDNYIFAFKTAPFFRYFVNSLFVVISSVTVCTFTTILGAFAFSRLRFPGREFIFGALLAMMMVPFEMLIITNYRTITKWKINNTLWSLIIPFMSSIFYTYILKNFFDTVPDSLYQAARVDGCSDWKYLWRVMVPIAKPSLVTIILLNAIASWNSFLWPMLATSSANVRTLPFGLYNFVTEGGARNEVMMAAATIVVLPMLILFLFARKYIVNGVARGGLKG
ncbi:MAG: carbohydrate ABC transporter permease [Anaerolineaceae bacterium]|nr:carbohydrate ABC transporter permease [Anaerolineaceae bacterium]